MLTPAPRIDHFASADGYRCAVRVWEAAQPVARIVCLHGIISHAGWYSLSCRHLARAGFEVHFLDRRGSGLNAATRGDVDAYQTWLADVEDYLASLPGQLPRILLGISWGGKLAAAVARHRPQAVDALGLLCPGLFAQKGANRLQRLALFVAGRLRLGARRVTIPLQDPALFTGSANWQAYIASDPLTLRKITIRFALADLQLTRYATQAPQQIQVPTLLMLARRDRIIDNRRVADFLNRLGSRDKTVIEYPQATHTLEFEPDPSQFLADLTEWARGVASSRSGPRAGP
jgi:acylglycerol lipase